jgi:cell division septation protein DedD
MLEDLINRQWQGLAKFLRGRKLFSSVFAGKLRPQKPSLMIAIGKRRREDALEEYRRRFDSTAGQGNPEKQLAVHALRQLQLREKAKLPEVDIRDQRDWRLRAIVSSGGSSSQPSGRNWVFLVLALLRSYHALASIRARALISVMMACAIALGAAHGYRMIMASNNDSSGTIVTVQPSQEPAGPPHGGKLYSDRLMAPDGDEASIPPAQLGAAALQDKDQPTAVHSESYVPDVTRTETVRPAAVPSIVSFLEAAKPPEAIAGGEALPANNAHVEEPAVRPATEPTPSSESGYFVQFKADQDQKAAETALAGFLDRYKSVLGDTPLITRLADLKEKGIWFRVMAGPIKSRDEAAGLCKKLKSAGLQACIVQRFD